MARGGGWLRRAIALAKYMADRQHARSLRGPLVPDDSQRGAFLLADPAFGDPGGRFPGARVHHFSRLRPRLVFQIAEREQHVGLHHGRPVVHTLFSLALAARRSPRNVGRFGPAWLGRCLDADRRGIPGRLTLETVPLSHGKKSRGSFCPGTAFPVYGRATVPVLEGQQEGTPFGLLDQPGHPGRGRRDEHDRGLERPT